MDAIEFILLLTSLDLGPTFLMIKRFTDIVEEIISASFILFFRVSIVFKFTRCYFSNPKDSFRSILGMIRKKSRNSSIARYAKVWHCWLRDNHLHAALAVCSAYLVKQNSEAFAIL